MKFDTKLKNAVYQDYFERPRTWALTGTDRTVLIVILVVLLGIRLLLMIWLPVTDTTEARYVEIARKMLETGNWITPQYDYGIPFMAKPPLHTWASALGMKYLGVDHFGARVPILLFAVAVLCVLFVFVRRHLGRDLALICVTVLSSSVLFFGASAFVMTDTALTLGTTLSMCAFYIAVTDKRRNPLWESLFFVGLAVGLMAKGPVAMVLTMIPIFFWLLFGGRWNKLRRLHWGRGLLLLTVLSFPWYLAAEHATPGFLRYFIVGEHFERFVVSGWQGDLYGKGHEQPTGMIWVYACLGFFPWFFFASALFWKIKDIGEEIVDDTKGWHSYLTLWAVSPMLLFSPAANLLPAYVLPGLPAASILLSSLWLGAFGKPDRKMRVAFLSATGGTGALYLFFTLTLVSSPDTLNLRTEKALVETAYAIDPNIQLTYFGKRSYSAEFYSDARVNFEKDLSGVASLSQNSRRDALAIPQHLLSDLVLFNPVRFENIGLFRNHYLLVETVALGAPL